MTTPTMEDGLDALEEIDEDLKPCALEGIVAFLVREGAKKPGGTRMDQRKAFDHVFAIASGVVPYSLWKGGQKAVD